MSEFLRTRGAVALALLAIGVCVGCAERVHDGPSAQQIERPGYENLERGIALAKSIENSPDWQALKRRFRPAIDDLAEDPTGAAKYFRIRIWMRGAVHRWHDIERQHPELVTPGTSVLDISTGFGYFPLVGERIFGVESIEATDAPGLRNSELYDVVTDYFGITKYELFVSKFEPVHIPNDGRRYDLITSYSIVFDYVNGEWGEPEWQFFLSNVRDSLLNEGGAIVLGFNNPNGIPFMEWAAPLGASYLDPENRAVVILPWQALERFSPPQE